MIGVFDSGYGGLTILAGLKRVLPQYSYIYMGDNAHAPYGPKTDEEIFELTKKGAEVLFEKGCELVILACNTASASALRRLQQEWLPATHPHKKILGIIVPTIEAIGQLPHKTVGVLATQHTVATGVYAIEANKRNMDSKIVQQACNNLAGLIEQYGAGNEVVKKEVDQCVARLLAQIPQPDAVLLGCTHYEFIADAIKKSLPASTVLIRQPEIVANSLKTYLERHPEIENNLQKTGVCQYFTTGNPEEVSRNSEALTGEKIIFNAL